MDSQPVRWPDGYSASRPRCARRSCGRSMPLDRPFDAASRTAPTTARPANRPGRRSGSARRDTRASRRPGRRATSRTPCNRSCVARRSATRIRSAPSVRYTAAEVIAWPLGKLSVMTSRRCGTTAGPRALKGSFSSEFSNHPPVLATNTNRAVRRRPCRSRNPTTAATTRPSTEALPSAVMSSAAMRSHAGPIGATDRRPA